MFDQLRPLEYLDIGQPRKQNKSTDILEVLDIDQPTKRNGPYPLQVHPRPVQKPHNYAA